MSMLTTSKEAQLRKSLIKKSVSMAVVLIILSGIGFWLSGYNDTAQSDMALKQNQNNMISSQYREIETDLGIENEVARYYDDYVKAHNRNFVIDRDTIATMLAALRKTHHLIDTEVTLSPITEISDNNFILKSGKAVKSTVHVTFAGITDNSVYNFIYDLKHKLPGIVLVSDLKITKNDQLSKEVLLTAMNSHTITPVIKGEMTFTWLGIAPTPENAKDAMNAK